MTIIVRDYDPTDYEACCRLALQTNTHFHYFHPALVAVDVESGIPAGFITWRDLQTDRGKWEVSQIVVAHGRRRHGIGRLLLQTLIEHIPPGLRIDVIGLITQPDFRIFLDRCGVPWTSVTGGDCGSQKWTWRHPVAATVIPPALVTSQEPQPC